jgi:transposase
MALSLLPAPLWREIEPLLPPEPHRPKGGRPRVPDRACLTGIIFVLRTGLPWNTIPVELGCGSGPTCWRRLRDRAEAGVWDAVHKKLLNALGRRGKIDPSRALIDSASVRAVFGGLTRALTPRIGRSAAANATA